ncbi:MAG: PilN domain-containing protein [bacterium]|nr:PilN domain-containing protein [bacterium]
MNEDINLIPGKRKVVLEQKKIVKRLRILSIVLLSTVAFSSIALFLLKLQSPLPSLKREENTLLASLSLLHQKTAKLLLMKNRLKETAIIEKKRQRLDETIGAVVEGVPADVSLSSLSVGKKDVSITASSNSLSSVNIFLDRLVNKVLQKKTFSKITLDSLSLDSKGNRYIIAFTLELL